MKRFNAEITKDNIFELIRHSGISLEAFGNIIGVSKRWVHYLKKGTYKFDLAGIEKACEFFNIQFTKLTTRSIIPPDNYRISLQSYHKRNPEYSKILTENPSISYIIEFVLLKDKTFLSQKEMEIKDVKRILLKYNLVYKGSSLSTEFQKSEFIEHWPHPTKKNTYLYKIKQIKKT